MNVIDHTSEAALARYGEFWRSKSLFSRIFHVLWWRLGTIWAGITGTITPGERLLATMCKQIQDERDAARIEACLHACSSYRCLPDRTHVVLLRHAAQTMFSLEEAEAAQLFPGERA